MPLIEVVKTPKTDDAALSTAMVDGREACARTRSSPPDAPGFVVNRLLAKLLGEAMHAVDAGHAVRDRRRGASRRSACRWTRSCCSSSSGSKVGAHVLDTHHAAFPDRFFESAEPARARRATASILEKDGKGKVTGFDKKAARDRREAPAADATPLHGRRAARRIEDGLADEIHRMLDDGVVAAAEDIDLCMILGAGWPFQMGGATPYLDRVGASERVFGDTFHHPLIKGVS